MTASDKQIAYIDSLISQLKNRVSAMIQRDTPDGLLVANLEMALLCEDAAKGDKDLATKLINFLTTSNGIVMYPDLMAIFGGTAKVNEITMGHRMAAYEMDIEPFYSRAAELASR